MMVLRRGAREAFPLCRQFLHSTISLSVSRGPSSSTATSPHTFIFGLERVYGSALCSCRQESPARMCVGSMAPDKLCTSRSNTSVHEGEITLSRRLVRCKDTRGKGQLPCSHRCLFEKCIDHPARPFTTLPHNSLLPSTSNLFPSHSHNARSSLPPHCNVQPIQAATLALVIDATQQATILPTKPVTDNH